MITRRHFLESLVAAGVAIPSLKDRALARVVSANQAVAGRSPDDVARDEDFWLEVQQAFTLDRTIINLNNGGVSPSPRVVQEAMRRYLEYSNTAPVYTMWQVLEPEIEAVRRRLAASFGCDPEEMAITRNASEALEIVQLGIPLERGDEVLTTNQDYPRMLTTWHQRERREGIVLKEIGFPVPPPSQDDHAADQSHPSLPHHEPHGADLSDQEDRASGARPRDPGDRGRRTRLRALPVQPRRARVRLLRHEPPQVAARAPRHRIPLRAEGENRAPLALEGRAARDERRHPQVRGDRHPPRGEPQRHRRGAHVPRGAQTGAQGRPAALPVPALGEAARRPAQGADPH